MVGFRCLLSVCFFALLVDLSISNHCKSLQCQLEGCRPTRKQRCCNATELYEGRKEDSALNIVNRKPENCKFSYKKSRGNLALQVTWTYDGPVAKFYVGILPERSLAEIVVEVHGDEQTVNQNSAYNGSVRYTYTHCGSFIKPNRMFYMTVEPIHSYMGSSRIQLCEAWVYTDCCDKKMRRFRKCKNMCDKTPEKTIVPTIVPEIDVDENHVHWEWKDWLLVTCCLVIGVLLAAIVKMKWRWIAGRFKSRIPLSDEERSLLVVMSSGDSDHRLYDACAQFVAELRRRRLRVDFSKGQQQVDPGNFYSHVAFAASPQGRATVDKFLCGPRAATWIDDFVVAVDRYVTGERAQLARNGDVGLAVVRFDDDAASDDCFEAIPRFRIPQDLDAFVRNFASR